MRNRPTPEEMLAAAYALDGSNEASEDLYGRWAETYDEDLAEEGYLGPHLCALLVRQAVDTTSPRVLDLGCGTGLVGRELASYLPDAYVVGADLSLEMTQVAERSGAYDEVHAPVDLKQHLPESVGSGFDAVVCCGTFTLGHVSPTAIVHLVEPLRPGGTASLSVNRRHSQDEDFLGVIDSLVSTGLVEKVSELFNAPLTDLGGGDYWTLRRR